MAAGDLITAAWQFELNGLLMGYGTTYTTIAFDTWAAPEVRAGESSRAQAHGDYPGTDWLGGRLITLEFSVNPSTQPVEIAARQALTAAWCPPSDGSTVPLVWREGDGVTYRVNGKPRLASPRAEYRLPTECRFVGSDPRIYANTLSTASTPLTTATSGLTFPATAPFVFGSGGTGNTMSCANAGTFPTSWVATFTGPLVAPELVHLGTGKRITLSGASLAAGETLVVDSDARTVLLNGTASRYSWLAPTSQWFSLAAGANSVMLLGASGSGSVSLAWRSAWI